MVTAGLSACGKGDDKSGGANGFRPAQGGKFYGGVHNINEAGELTSLDPVLVADVVSTHAANQIYELLVDLDQATLAITPEWAERYDVSPDGLTYTFHLRRDVTFHDDACFPGGKGRRFVAADVKYSFERVCNPKTLTKGFDLFAGKVVGADAYYDAMSKAASADASPVKEVTGFKAPNDSTFQIALTQPFAPFIYAVVGSEMYIAPHEAVEKYGRDFGRHPVGTGAFRFGSYAEGQLLTLVRNPSYWGHDEAGNQLPLLDEIHMHFIAENKTQLMELRNGNLEENYRIATEFRDEVLSPDGQKLQGDLAGYQLQRVPSMYTQYYGLLTTKPPFNDKRVRQAFNYAVDRGKIVKYVLKGEPYGPADHGVVPPSMPDYPIDSVRGYTFDPAKAKRLLAEAGYPNGKGFPKTTLLLNSGGKRNEDMAEAVQAMIRQTLDVPVDLQIVSFPQLLETTRAGKIPFWRGGWVADYPDPETFLNQLYGKLVPTDPAAESYPNTTRYHNPTFDRLYEQALHTVDRTERMRLYARAEQVAVDDAPMLFMQYEEDYRILAPYVRDYPINAMDRRDLKTVWFDPAAMK